METRREGMRSKRRERGGGRNRQKGSKIWQKGKDGKRKKGKEEG